jgi:hypothetical protein
MLYRVEQSVANFLSEQSTCCWKIKFASRESKSTWLQVLRILTNGADVASAALVFSHAPPCHQEDSPTFLVEHTLLAPHRDRCESCIQDTTKAVEKGLKSSVPLPAPPGPSCVPSKYGTHTSTCINDLDSAIAIDRAESPPPPPPPAAAPTHQRGPLPVLVRRAKASSPPSALPAGPAAPAQQAHGRNDEFHL